MRLIKAVLLYAAIPQSRVEVPSGFVSCCDPHNMHAGSRLVVAQPSAPSPVEADLAVHRGEEGGEETSATELPESAQYSLL